MTLPVKYIGRRATYRDGACGTGLVFAQGETKMVPAEAARKMLRHSAVYVAGEVKGATQALHVVKVDTTEEDLLQDLRDTVAYMDKESLETYARTNFKIDLDKRKSILNLRQQVTQLLDQYGAA